MLLLADDLGHPLAAVVRERLGRVLDSPGRDDVAEGLIVGGRCSSCSGATANRLITSIAAAAFSSRTVTRPASQVSTTRLPRTSATSSTPSARRASAGAASSAGGNGRAGS